MSMMFISWFWLIPKSCPSIWSNVPLRRALYTSGWSGNAPKPAHKQTQEHWSGIPNTEIWKRRLPEQSFNYELRFVASLILWAMFPLKGTARRAKKPPTSRPVDGHCCPSCSCRCEFAKTCNWRQHKDMHLRCVQSWTLSISETKPGELKSSTKNKTEIQKKNENAEKMNSVLITINPY